MTGGLTSLRVALLCAVALGTAQPLGAQPAPLRPERPSSAVQMRAAVVHPAAVGYARRVAPPDPWWAQDKLQHLAFSALWTLSAQYVLVEKADWSNRASLPLSAGSAAGVGLSKELFDWRLGPSRRFSRRDLVADAAGILLAVGLIVL